MTSPTLGLVSVQIPSLWQIQEVTLLSAYIWYTVCLRSILSLYHKLLATRSPDIRQIIHWGVPEDAETYVQESGRDNNICHALLLYNKEDLSPKYTTTHMKEYCTNNTICRRHLLFAEFEATSCVKLIQGCACCDVCSKKCKCEKCSK